jgi:hypothetical protein
MSIATLKRKTFAKYNNNSVGTGFSLNGTRRSQGWIGQDTIGRSFPKTLMKGNTVKGHGGCCGSYLQNNIIASAVTSLNDPSVIKTSTIHNDGMLRTKYRWIWRPQPYSTTKDDSSRTINSQSQYITSLSSTISSIIDTSYSEVMKTKGSNNYCCDLLIPVRARPRAGCINPQIKQTRNPGNFVKTNMSRPEGNNPLIGILGGDYVNFTVNQSTYISYLDKQCIPDISSNELSNNFSSNCTQKPMPQNLLQTPLISGSRTFGT